MEAPARRRALLVVAASAAALVAGAHFTERGTVARVVDGDTLHVLLRNGDGDGWGCEFRVARTPL